MNCSESQPLLQDFLDGRLRPNEEREVEAHLSSCAACKQELALYRQVFDALATEPDPDVQLTESIMAKVAAEQATRRPDLWSVWTAVAACILVAIAAWLVASPPQAMTDPLLELMTQVNDLGASLDEGSQQAYVAAVDNCLDAWAATADATRQVSMAEVLGSISFPQIPVLAVIAACIAALAVDLYCLRRGSSLTTAHLLAL